MSMRSFRMVSAAVSSLIVLVLAPAATLAETLLLDTSNTDHITPPWDPSHGVWSSPLQAGQQYWIEVEGVWYRDSIHICDAEWYEPEPDEPWLEDYPGYPGLLDVQINDTSLDWLGFVDVDGDDVPDPNEWFIHTLSPTHRYGLPWLGDGQPLKFSVYDLGYENSGILTITITPEPATLWTMLVLSFSVLRRR